MNCIEVIRIRLATGNLERLKSRIEQLAREFRSMDPQVYQHSSIKNDFSIHLTHEWNSPEASANALHLVASLKELGLVNHSTWIQVNGRKS